MGWDGALGKAISFGGSGVHLFFLVSGFGLGFYKKMDSIKFWKKRLAKIYPPFFLALTISLIFSLILDIYPDKIGPYLGSIAIIPIFWGYGLESFGGHLWFMSTIFQFYLIFPLLFLLKDSIGVKRLLILSIAISISFWSLLYMNPGFEDRIWNSFFLQYLWEFVLGMFFADLYQRKNIGFWNIKWYDALSILVFFGLLFVALTLKLGKAVMLFNDIPILICYTSISILLWIFLKNYVPALYQFVLKIGLYSFSLYLIHPLVYLLYTKSLQVLGVPINLVSLIGVLPMVYLATLGFDKLSGLISPFFKEVLLPASIKTQETVKT